MPTISHDARVSPAFGEPDLDPSALANVLPRAITSNLDLTTLAIAPGSFVDDELRHVHTDRLYAAKTKDDRDALVFVLFEHQSMFDALMPLRILRYVVRVRDNWVHEHSNAEEIPTIFPVLLHHGPTGWHAPPDQAPLFDASPSPLDAALPFLSLFQFVLYDEGSLPRGDNGSRTLDALTHLVELAFWSARSFDRLQQAAPLMGELAASVPRDMRTKAVLEQIYIYVFRTAQPDVDVRDVRALLFDIAGPQGREDVMNVTEQGRSDASGFARNTALA